MKAKDSLFTLDFLCLAAANFLLFFAFYAVMPLLPFYLQEVHTAPSSVAGLMLASYSAACILIRPLAGYVLDIFRRRPVYLLAYLLFMIVFCGYMIAGTWCLFILFRMLHGLAFGTATVAGNTIVVDILPSARRGEGLGLYGLANTVAMCIGPMTGLFLHRHLAYNTVFLLAGGCCLLGLLLAARVKVPLHVPPAPAKKRVSIDQLFIVKGAWPALVLMLTSVPYGMTTAYVAVYAGEIALNGYSGLFYALMAVGLGAARLLSGRWVDKGKVTFLITLGLTLVAGSFFALSSLKGLAAFGGGLVPVLYLAIAFLQGIAFGLLHPAFNLLFVQLVPAGRRGAATSTYLTSWDAGIGTGIFAGAAIAGRWGGFSVSYFAGALLVCLAFLLFLRKAKGQYLNNRIT